MKQRKKVRREEGIYVKKYCGYEKKMTRRPNCSSGFRASEVATPAVDELLNEPNLHLVG